MIDKSKPKGNKGRNKRKCKRSKITFAELLDKYQKKSEEKNAYRPNHAKKPRSPQGANMRIGIGKVIILMQHIHILILGRQCQCRGCLPMLIQIHIHHGTGMIQGHILHLILDHLTNTMQLQGDQHLNNHASKTVSIIRNRSRAQGRRKRW